VADHPVRITIEIRTGKALKATLAALRLVADFVELVPEWNQAELAPLLRKARRVRRLLKSELKTVQD
jgi:hypothetical protein